MSGYNMTRRGRKVTPKEDTEITVRFHAAEATPRWGAAGRHDNQSPTNYYSCRSRRMQCACRCSSSVPVRVCDQQSPVDQ